MNTAFANPANTPAADSLTHQPWIPLEDLLHDYQLGLVVIAGGGGDAGARPVQWVHPSDLVDPAPFLTPRTVLLTTGVQFPGTLSPGTAETYVTRLVDAGVSALGVAVGLRWDRIPPTLIRACEEHRLPLVRVPYDTPFIAISRAATRLIEAAVHARSMDRTDNLSRAQRSAPHLARVESAVRSAVLRLLTAGEIELATSVAAELLPPLPRGQIVVLSLDDRSGAVRPAIDSAIDGVISGDLDHRSLIVCETSRLAPIRRLLDRNQVAAGVSERGRHDDLTTLIDQADRALENAQSLEAPSIVEYRPSMHSGVLQLLTKSREARRRAHGLLAPITAHDERHGDTILVSLETWLAHNGQLSPAAEDLGVHRHTLRSRIRTAASLLQRDIDSPDTRAEIWTALRLLHAEQQGESAR
ncbi:PucR family transcriptional regulator [Leucobacter sp. cx-42]|uniref:PucR family transcriptional regulator n=1 Tax=unclassified Leucobacter TaxID=2621730 RepID=UPI00165E4717|nr:MULTISPECIES: PucR family transcriptional regulator [unclassified Leucobacter]MBC9954707.1 PucR family transcriptional regulator [Leucobacter sp. cx-42]